MTHQHKIHDITANSIDVELPDSEHTDNDDRCWWWRTDGIEEYWELVGVMNVYTYNAQSECWKYTHWLPYWAIPNPVVEIINEETTMTIDKYELASALAQLLRELPGHACWGTDLRLLQASLADYNERNAEPAPEEEVVESVEEVVEKNPDSGEEVDQSEELELLKILADAHSWLGYEPAPKFSKMDSTYPCNNDEIERYHSIRAALIRFGAYITKKMG